MYQKRKLFGKLNYAILQGTKNSTCPTIQTSGLGCRASVKYIICNTFFLLFTYDTQFQHCTAPLLYIFCISKRFKPKSQDRMEHQLYVLFLYLTPHSNIYSFFYTIIQKRHISLPLFNVNNSCWLHSNGIFVILISIFHLNNNGTFSFFVLDKQASPFRCQSSLYLYTLLKQNRHTFLSFQNLFFSAIKLLVPIKRL